MGSFKAATITVKEIRETGLKIVFYDKETIYAHDDRRGWFVFHRWDAQLGSYGSWRKFRHLMWYEKKLDFSHCFRIAHRYDISWKKARKEPDLNKSGLIKRISV